MNGGSAQKCDMEAFASVEPRERPDRPDPWHGVERADQLASAIHDSTFGKYPNSQYAKLYGSTDATGFRFLGSSTSLPELRPNSLRMSAEPITTSCGIRSLQRTDSHPRLILYRIALIHTV